MKGYTGSRLFFNQKMADYRWKITHNVGDISINKVVRDGKRISRLCLDNLLLLS